MSAIERLDDPFARHMHRDPLPGAGVRVILLTDRSQEEAEAILAPVLDHLIAIGRPVESRILSVDGSSLARLIESGFEGATLPLVLITTAAGRWSPAHLDPLLKAIDHCDHVVGRRPAGAPDDWIRWLRSLPRRFIFALPLLDIHSPCRLHRLEKLAAIPLQSASWFVDVEILAKATYLGHLIDEVTIPSLDNVRVASGWWSDWKELLRHPRFQPGSRSGPAEEA